MFTFTCNYTDCDCPADHVRTEPITLTLGDFDLTDDGLLLMDADPTESEDLDLGDFVGEAA